MGRGFTKRYLFLWLALAGGLCGAEPASHEKGAPAPVQGGTADSPSSDRCPAWAREKGAAPKCPEGGSRVLPDTYPALAHVVSDDFNPHYGNWEPTNQIEYWKEIKRRLAIQFTLKALQASDPKNPLLFLAVHPDTLRLIREAVERATEGDKEKRARWLGSLIHAPDAVFLWQQDPMKAMRDPSQEGGVSLSPIPDYIKARHDKVDRTRALIRVATQACSLIKEGAPLTLPPGEKYGDGHAGGNIVGLPGGLVAHGPNQSEAFAKPYAGSADNQVVVDTSWLYVGHADEMMSVIPNAKEPEPCNFAIALPSPRKAMELLASDASRSGRFITPPTDSAVVTAEQEVGYRTKFSMWWLCNGKVLAMNKERRAAKQRELSSAEENAFVAKCEKMNNGEVAAFIRSFPEWNVTYELIQERLDATKAQLQARLEGRLPQCAGKIRFVELPVLYQVMHEPIKIAGADPSKPLNQRYRLAKEAVRAWLPNPVNSVVAGQSLIGPHPHNEPFAKYAKDALQEVGVTSELVDDYYYAHFGSGNVHCATHSLRFCQ
jgi:hypothetical protein